MSAVKLARIGQYKARETETMSRAYAHPTSHSAMLNGPADGPQWMCMNSDWNPNGNTKSARKRSTTEKLNKKNIH